MLWDCGFYGYSNRESTAVIVPLLNIYNALPVNSPEVKELV